MSDRATLHPAALQALFEMAPENLDRAHVAQTIVGGRIVYERR